MVTCGSRGLLHLQSLVETSCLLWLKTLSTLKSFTDLAFESGEGSSTRIEGGRWKGPPGCLQRHPLPRPRRTPQRTPPSTLHDPWRLVPHLNWRVQIHLKSRVGRLREKNGLKSPEITGKQNVFFKEDFLLGHILLFWNVRAPPILKVPT